MQGSTTDCLKSKENAVRSTEHCIRNRPSLGIRARTSIDWILTFTELMETSGPHPTSVARPGLLENEVTRAPYTVEWCRIDLGNTDGIEYGHLYPFASLSSSQYLLRFLQKAADVLRRALT
ncbi:hypothetical protein CPSG_00683 [Coccidioides posadasii str. Silveira]|uniref:Uncharacterized protein n=1 Tax=Coccidioides posadasii (strain RMSCC 757 / Silveira) TaxID=443226 RepID=E9CSX4_COCPS|nr:hypothetical protein CPSG_00683 [Coccidioides posadasii str. Silveira]